MVLDKSGSMQIARELTVRGFNEQVQTIKDTQTAGMETFVSLVTFNHEVVPEFMNKDVSFLKELTQEDYYPRGNTALFDAVGYTIDELTKIAVSPQDDVAYLLIIFSDGEENASRKFSQKDIAERIQAVQDTGKWTVTYMGAVHDLDKLCKEMNLVRGNVSVFDTSNIQGYTEGMTRTTKGLGSYMMARNAGGKSVMSFYSVDTKEEAPK